MPAQKTPIKASTQAHLDIEDIQDDLVILKDGSCCLVLKATAINFDLFSETEQEAIIHAYAALLNSLNFPIQIIINTQKKNITAYLRLLKAQENKIKNKLLKRQMKKYRQFIKKTVQKAQVLEKKFYIIIPFSSLELGISKSLTKTFFKGKKELPFPKEYILERAKVSLYPKRDHLIKQFNRLGLQPRQLTSQELLELFYNIYNPELIGEKLSTQKEYTSPLISREEKSSEKKQEKKP